MNYTFSVTMVNEDGLESEGQAVEATTGSPGKPSAPVHLQVTSHDKDHISLMWAPPKDIGGASVTAYHVFRDGTAVATVVGRNPDTGEDLKELTWKDTTVQSGQKYKYAVSAMHLPTRTLSNSDLNDLLIKRAS